MGITSRDIATGATTLTDAEREAVANMIFLIETKHDDHGKDAFHLRALLSRSGDTTAGSPASHISGDGKTAAESQSYSESDAKRVNTTTHGDTTHDEGSVLGKDADTVGERLVERLSITQSMLADNESSSTHSRVPAPRWRLRSGWGGAVLASS